MTGGVSVFSKKSFEPITKRELKKQVDKWNKERNIKSVMDLIKDSTNCNMKGEVIVIK